ncbi:hypothetical protein [Sediminibacterium sp.]|uniref:hypothetical protein n=1 Tax=Sediminibacterium sp. TaxID=1917865 RepID=UPI002737469F|nr:hypothetical protein [Sediminibacterium sp.]MDP3567396.1 hypothetical protein [Sediminibacterium sp.]
MRLNWIFVLFFSVQSGLYSQEIELPTSPLTNLNSNTPLGEQTTNPEINRIISIVNTVESKNNFIDQLNPDSNVSLPFGIIKQTGAVRYTIAIDSMRFLPAGAYFSAYAAIDFPGSTKKLAFRGSNIKFNPSGVIGGEQAKLYLASDHLISINASVSLKLLGNGQNYVVWDCQGFKSINLVGHFIFKKGKLLPDESQTQDSVVTASFQINTENLHDFIASVEITPFKIKGLNDWSFRVTNAIVDMSELNNANSMMFPTGYLNQNPNIVTPQMWTGFYLQALKVKLPREISKAGTRTEINVNNLLIDNMGVSGLFQVNNIMGLSEGSMSGWNFSVEEVGVGFVSNQLVSGHLKGRINIPIMDSAQSLQYNANINFNSTTKEIDYSFVINPVSNIDFNVFSANVSLNNNSNISFQKINGTFKPTATLCGQMAFNHSKFNSNGGKLSFQNVVITSTAPYITNGVFTLHTINGLQPKTSHFPISLNDITFGVNQGVPVFGFSVTLNLSDQTSNSLSVGTSILLKGKIDTSPKTYLGDAPLSVVKTKWKFDKVVINGISVDLQTSPFTLAGTILFKDDDPIYGDAFFGQLNMSIKKVMPNPASVSVCFGSKPSYRYFYLDAKIPVAFNLGSLPIKITRLIGGLYYHMNTNKTTESDFISLNQNFNSVAGNALTYVPSQTTSIGLKAGISYEFLANEVPYNGDLMLDVNFTNSGGLGVVSLAGDVYSMVTINQRPKAPIKGKMAMTYDAQNRIFDALASVNINSYQVITGTGYFKIHIDPQVWYLCVGKPSTPNNISFLGLVNVPSYFMVGNSLESPMAPPAQVAANAGVAGVLGNRNLTQLQSAGGFCAGSRITSSINKGFGLSFFNVAGSFNFDLGFDMMMTNYGENATCSNSSDKIGMNGWLAQGDMYLAMGGAISINGNFKFPGNCPSSTTGHLCGPGHCCCYTINYPCLINTSFNFNVFSGAVTAITSAKAPRPTYFAGQLNCNYDICGKVSGNFNYDFSYGTNCNPISN